MKALLAFYGVDIPKPILANLVLSVEIDELGIQAGLQDRVAQVYQGLVYMDFSKSIMDVQGYGKYEYLDPNSLPNLYIAYLADLAEGSEKVHSTYRSSYQSGEEAFAKAVIRWAQLTEETKAYLQQGQPEKIAALLDENFDLRNSVRYVGEGNHRLITTARSVGASAKFTGSGGAIIGTYNDEKMYENLARKLDTIGASVLKPEIAGT